MRAARVLPSAMAVGSPCAAAMLQLRGGSEPHEQLGMSSGPLQPQLPNPVSPGNNAELLAQLSKDTLQAELERRGFDSVGAKSVLAIRLNRIMAEGVNSHGTDLHSPDRTSNTMRLHHSQGEGARTGEGDMMDVDAAGKSASPPTTVTPARRGDTRQMGRRAMNEQHRSRRGISTPRSARVQEGGREAARRSWEGLKSGNMKVSPSKNAPPFRNSRGGQDGGRQGASDGRGGSSPSPHSGVANRGGSTGDGRGMVHRSTVEGRGASYPTRRAGGRQQRGRGVWRPRGSGEGRGNWKGGGMRSDSQQGQFVAPGEHTGWRRKADVDGGAGSCVQGGGGSGSGDRGGSRPLVLVAGAQVGEKFGTSTPIAAGGAGRGAFGVGGACADGAFGAGDGATGDGKAGQEGGRGGTGGAFGILPPLPSLPAAGMGDDSL